MTLTELNAHIAHAGKEAGCKAQHLTLEGRCVNCGFNPERK